MSGSDSLWISRLTAARDAQSRTRYAFVAATIISVAILINEFNATFSWYIQFVLNEKVPVNAITEMAQRQLIQEWVKSDRMTVSMLGVNFGMSDAAILGSLSIYILSLWFFVCIRRENHLIVDLLSYASQKADEDANVMLFHGIADYMVFTTITKDDEPRDVLGPPTDKNRPLFWFRPSLKVLVHLPIIAIAFIVFSDIISLFRDAPYREGHGVLWREIIKSPPDLAHFAVGEAIALIAGTATFFMCANIMRFEIATGKVLRSFYNKHMMESALPHRA
jgi:hypothetical protein